MSMKNFNGTIGNRTSEVTASIYYKTLLFLAVITIKLTAGKT